MVVREKHCHIFSDSYIRTNGVVLTGNTDSRKQKDIQGLTHTRTSV